MVKHNDSERSRTAQRDRVRRRWDGRAERYDATGPRLERLAIGDSREWTCSRARGRTLEVAIGTGRNLSLYGRDVRLSGLDLSSGMLARARSRAVELGRDVDLREGDAERLPYPNASFDTVAATLALCAIPDRAVAIAEMYRVLRPGGGLLLVDHVEPRWRRGRPADLALARGFLPLERQRLRLGMIERLAARKPA
jgi:ubiquinone/menaquinone biosynthesis C-methylase UbiE